MQRSDLDQQISITMESILVIKDENIYDQYKSQRISYEQIDIVQELVDQQTKKILNLNQIRQQRIISYDYITKDASNFNLTSQYYLNIAEGESIEGVHSLFINNNDQEEHQQQMVSQTESSKVEGEYPIFQEGNYTLQQIFAQQMKKRTSYLVEKLQQQIISGDYKNMVPYLNSRNLTIATLRKVLRDCIRTSLIYQHNVRQIRQDRYHQGNCCQRQMTFINKIYEIQTQAINKLYPEGKQSILRQLLGDNYDAIINKSWKPINKTQRIKPEK